MREIFWIPRLDTVHENNNPPRHDQGLRLPQPKTVHDNDQGAGLPRSEPVHVDPDSTP